MEGNRMIGKSLMDGGIGGNDQISYEAVGINGSGIKGSDVPVRAGESKSSTNGGMQVEESKDECDNVLQFLEPGSPTTIEVSGNGINLFVEVFGPLDGIPESNNDSSDKGLHVLGDGNKDGVLSSSIKSESTKNEVEGVGVRDHTFNVHDFVWVKTRSHLWWPGMISDLSDAASEETKSGKGVSFPVKYFGNSNVVWCSNLELKPFIEYFNQMSRQINSRNFVGAVEKAIFEIGQRARSSMTCRCFSKESQTLSVPLLLESKKHESNALSLSQFEPAGFVARLRCLAQCTQDPGKVELTIIKSRLLAFYCSIGHQELPLQLVISSSDAAQKVQDEQKPEVMDEGGNSTSGRRKNSGKTPNGDRVLRRGKRNCSDDASQDHDDKVMSSEKASESRERKKSKYLSYPYVDVKHGINAKSTVDKEAEDPEQQSSMSPKSTPQVRSNGTGSSRKRGSRKPTKGRRAVSKADNIDARSAELLAELHSTARDCFYISGSKYSDSLRKFYCSFRNYSFVNANKAVRVPRRQQEPDGEKSIHPKSTETTMEGIKVAKASKKKRGKLPKPQLDPDDEKSISQNPTEANVEGIKMAKASKKQRGKLPRKHQEPDGEKSVPQNSTEGQAEGIKAAKPPKKPRVKRASIKKIVDKVANSQVSETRDPQAEGSALVEKAADEVVHSQPTETNEGSASVKKTVDEVVYNQVSETKDPQAKESTSVKKTVDKVVGKSISGTMGSQAKGAVKRTRAKRKKEQVMPASQQSTSTCASTDKNDNPDSSCMIGFQQICSNVPKIGTAPKKREGCVQLPTSNCLSTDKKDFPDASRVISFQNICSDVPKTGTAPEKAEGSAPVLPQMVTVAQLPDLNGKHPGEAVKQVPMGVPSAGMGNLFTKQRPGGVVSPNVSSNQPMDFPPFPPGIPCALPKFTHPVNGTSHYQNAGVASGSPQPNVTPNTGIISFLQPPNQMGPFPFAGTSEPQQRKRKSKTLQIASVIPDLNGNVLDAGSSGKTTAIPEGIPISPDGMPPQKKARNQSSGTEPGSNGKINEDLGGSLILNFAPGSTLPSSETLVAKFSRYGLLKESEIKVLDDSSVQIVYERSADARFAYRRLEKGNPFEAALTNFKLNCTAPAPKVAAKKSNNSFQMPQPFSPLGPRKTPPPAKPAAPEKPDIAVIRQNVEKMKLTLEKAGNTLAPEIRTKLENEIKAFLDKYNIMGRSSSSS